MTISNNEMMRKKPASTCIWREAGHGHFKKTQRQLLVLSVMIEDEEKCQFVKKICYRVASHQLSHGSQTLPHCAVCQAPERDVEPRLKKLNKICKSRHITWSRGNSEGCPRKIWKPPSSEKTEPSLTLQNNNYCNNIESGITIKQNTRKK